MKIIEVNHSIANRFNNYIEVNKHLKKYPKLYNPILEHELAHTNEAWSLKDFKLDFISDNKVNHFKLIKFMVRHPLSFLQLSPLLYSKKKGFVIDINLLVMYIIMTLVFLSVIYFGVNYL